MIPKVDYHMHTTRCGHATGDMRQYVLRAIEVGLTEIGFSEHLPLVTGPAPGYTMAEDEVDGYVQEVRDLQEEFPDLTIRLGIEADFVPGFEEHTRAWIERYPFDYVCGSVHFIQGWGFDAPQEQAGWQERNVDDVYRQFCELLRGSARANLFQIIGHCDLVKKYGHRPRQRMLDEWGATASAFQQAGVAVEINTSGLRKPVQEIYPSEDVLQMLYDHDVPIVFGSDAHAPDEVGQDLDLAYALARRVGYTEALRFADGKRLDSYPIPDVVDGREGAEVSTKHIRKSV